MGRGRYRKLTYIRLALLVPILAAAVIFHASGSTLIAIRIVRIALVALVLLAAGGITRFRRRDKANRSRD